MPTLTPMLFDDLMDRGAAVGEVVLALGVGAVLLCFASVPREVGVAGEVFVEDDMIGVTLLVAASDLEEDVVWPDGMVGSTEAANPTVASARPSPNCKRLLEAEQHPLYVKSWSQHQLPSDVQLYIMAPPPTFARP